MEYIQHSTEWNVSIFVVISGPDYSSVRYYHAKGFVWSSKIQPFFQIVIVYFTNVKSLLFYPLLLFFQFLDTWNSFSMTGSNILITYSGWVMFIFFTSANRSQHFLLRHSLICGDLILTDTEICMGDNLPNNLGVLLSFFWYHALSLQTKMIHKLLLFSLFVCIFQ